MCCTICAHGGRMTPGSMEKGRWAYLRLDRHRNPLIKLKCDICGAHGQFDTEEIMKLYGNKVKLRFKLVHCPRQGRDAIFAPCHLDYDYS